VTRAPRLDPTGQYASRLHEVFAYASTLLPVSDFLAERLVALGAPAPKVRVHPLGIPVLEPLPDPAASRRGITFVGRLVPLKGVDDLLDAVALLPEAVRRSTPVCIIGDGPARPALERQASHIPSADIRFLGHLPPPQVAERLASTRVFAGPSKSLADGSAEAYGLVYLEAARAGAPVVAYADGGVPSAVVDGRTGLLAPSGDVRALAGNLLTLLTNVELAQRLGAAGQARVISELDITDRTRVLEAMYDEVAARPVR
jgi:glycosyltransferase involved in cell wall biosynthesis